MPKFLFSQGNTYSRKHGWNGTSTYRIWCAMHQRCGNPNNNRYYRYGGRGIAVCERWQKFENFLADMGERPANRSLDRIDNDGNYEPGNCRWATRRQQSKNQVQRNRDPVSGRYVGYAELHARPIHLVLAEVREYHWFPLDQSLAE